MKILFRDFVGDRDGKFIIIISYNNQVVVIIFSFKIKHNLSISQSII